MFVRQGRGSDRVNGIAMDEVGLRNPSKKIKPVIPSLNVLQPVGSKKSTGVQEVVESEGNVNVEGILAPRDQANAHAEGNKTPGLGAGEPFRPDPGAPGGAGKGLEFSGRTRRGSYCRRARCVLSC
jgi:hypothetical protein